MDKQFVTYEIAIALKRLGFNEACIKYYNIDFELSDSISDKYVGDIKNDRYTTEHVCAAPIWQQVIDWFREKYDIHIVITVNPYSEINDVNGYKIYKSLNSELKCVANNETQSWNYCYAREQAILKAIEICKKK